jgi:hypothetical protein
MPRGVQLKSRALHGRQPRSVKQAMEELCRVGRSDRPGWRSDYQPLFRERSDRLGSRSDQKLMFWLRSDRLSSQSNRPPLFPERSGRLGERSDR